MGRYSEYLRFTYHNDSGINGFLPHLATQIYLNYAAETHLNARSICPNSRGGYNETPKEVWGRLIIYREFVNIYINVGVLPPENPPLYNKECITYVRQEGA